MRTVLSVVVAAVFLGGCSGGRGAAPPRRSPSSAGPSASTSTPRTGPLTTGAGVLPGEKPPVEPAIARTRTNAGALAFAMYYEHALDWSLATTDPYLLRQISAPTCDACSRYIRSLDDLRRSNGHVVGGRIEVGRVSIVEGHTLVRAHAVVKVECVQRATSIALPSTTPSVVSKASQSTISFVYLVWLGSRWGVAGDFGP